MVFDSEREAGERENEQSPQQQQQHNNMAMASDNESQSSQSSESSALSSESSHSAASSRGERDAEAEAGSTSSGDNSSSEHSEGDGGEAGAAAPTPTVLVPTSESESILADVETLILFDWDDTLLASSHLASSGYRLDDTEPLPHNVVEQLSLLEDAVIPVLHLARSLGTLCIITNAETGWVELSCKKFMPRVVPHLEGLHVLSARSTFEGRFPGLPAKWKLEAFSQRISALPHAEPKNVISLGDSTAERDAVRTVTSRMTDVFAKSVKFAERPTIEQLWRELQLLRRSLRAICEMPDDLDLALTVAAVPSAVGVGNSQKSASSSSSSSSSRSRFSTTPMHDMRSSHPSVHRHSMMNALQQQQQQQQQQQAQQKSIHAHVPSVSTSCVPMAF